MIPQRYIEEWRAVAPWTMDMQVEQDLVIARAIVEMYSDDLLKKSLAFRGGTALHKLYLTPQTRYSEDIDLVQINSEPINPILKRMREKLTFLDDKFEELLRIIYNKPEIERPSIGKSFRLAYCLSCSLSLVLSKGLTVISILLIL
jgi:hypothetical protein